MTVASKLRLLARGVRDPRVVGGQVRDILEVRRDGPLPQPPGTPTYDLLEMAAKLSEKLGVDVAAFLDDPEFTAFQAAQRERAAAEVADHPFPLMFNASVSLARMAYCTVRALRPDVVVETGVASGLTSSFITYALQRNGSGELHSIDPGIGGTENELGWLVPEGARDRWHLHVGRSRALMPGLLKQLGPVGVFVHDGLHTYPTVLWEVSSVVGSLSRPAVVLADDCETNPAFADWALKQRPEVWSLVRTEHEGHLFGLALLA